MKKGLLSLCLLGVLGFSGCAKYYLINSKNIEPERIYTNEVKKPITETTLIPNTSIDSDGIPTISYTYNTEVIGYRLYSLIYQDNTDYHLDIYYLDENLKKLSFRDCYVQKEFYEKVKEDNLYTNFQELNRNALWDRDEIIEEKLIKEEYYSK